VADAGIYHRVVREMKAQN
jgi:hypothetical protein